MFCTWPSDYVFIKKKGPKIYQNSKNGAKIVYTVNCNNLMLFSTVRNQNTRHGEMKLSHIILNSTWPKRLAMVGFCSEALCLYFINRGNKSEWTPLSIKLEEHSVYALSVTQSLKFFHGTKTMTDHLCDRVLIMFRNFVYFAGAFIETLILWLYSFKVDLQSFPSCKF